MTVKLKWNGTALYLGQTRMAEVRNVWPVENSASEYIIGPNDFTSNPYESPDDCRQDCESHVRRLLAKAGAPDA